MLSVGVATAGFYENVPQPQSNSTLAVDTMGTWTFSPFVLPYAIGPGRINVFNVRDSSHFLVNVSATSVSRTNLYF